MNQKHFLKDSIALILKTQPGPFVVVPWKEAGASTPWRWEVHSAHQPIALRMFREAADVLADTLNHFWQMQQDEARSAT